MNKFTTIFASALILSAAPAFAQNSTSGSDHMASGDKMASGKMAHGKMAHGKAKKTDKMSHGAMKH